MHSEVYKQLNQLLNCEPAVGISDAEVSVTNEDYFLRSLPHLEKWGLVAPLLQVKNSAGLLLRLRLSKLNLEFSVFVSSHQPDVLEHYIVDYWQDENGSYH